jgi:4-hydroxy-4-methyl-2-oxoglutarate aldolase
MMIDDPPVLTIRREVPKPPADVIAAIGKAQTGHVADCMEGRGAMDWRIKPLDANGPSIVGRVITCQCYPADNLGVFGAMELAEPGDIIVAQADGYTGTAVIGDLVSGMMQNKGVLAFVTDGLVRDLIGIEEVGLAVFTMGATPNSPAKTGPGTAGLPIICGGLPVQSGDIALCDRDGVVIIPLARSAEVAAKLESLMAAEAVAVQAVKDGRTVPPAVTDILNGPQTVYVH